LRPPARFPSAPRPIRASRLVYASATMPTQAIKAIFWDLDDTLVMTSDHMKSAYAKAAEYAVSKNRKVDGDRLTASFVKQLGATPWDKEYKVPVFQWRVGFWENGLKEQGIRDPVLAEQLQTLWDATRLGEMKWLPGVPEMIRGFEAQGIKCAIITNGHCTVQRDKITSIRAGELFTWVINGGEEVVEGRKEKPDAGIFYKACKMVGCEPGEAVHVGDSLSTDVLGGQNAGLAGTVWISLGKAHPGKGPAPTITVAGVAEVPAALAVAGFEGPFAGVGGWCGWAGTLKAAALAAAFGAGFLFHKSRSS